MNLHKFKIWDNENQCWFTPEYMKPRQEGFDKEILISQQGEIYLNETFHDGKGGVVTSLKHYPQGTADEPGRFKPCAYTGHRDVNGVKWYLDDIVDGHGILIWYEDRLAVGKNWDGKEFQSIKHMNHATLRASVNKGNINNPTERHLINE